MEINDQNKHKVIEMYFQKQLDSEERRQFNQKYLEDLDFQQEVDEYKILHHTITEMSTENRERIDKIIADHTRKNAPTRVIKLWQSPAVYAVAATVSLLVVAGVIWLNNQDGTQNSLADQQEIIYSGKTAIFSEEPRLGFAPDPSAVVDSVHFRVFKSSSPQYRFIDDTLSLYLTQKPEDFSIVRMQGNTYSLQLNGQSFTIREGFNRIKELKAD